MLYPPELIALKFYIYIRKVKIAINHMNGCGDARLKGRGRDLVSSRLVKLDGGRLERDFWFNKFVDI